MRGLSILGLVLATTALSGKPAAAAAISYTAGEIHFDGVGGLPGTIALPDLSQGGTVELGSFVYGNPQGGTYPAIAQSVSGLFGFLVVPTTGQGPGLLVAGPFQGTINGPGGDPAHWSGSLSGFATQVAPSWTQGSTISQPLIDLISDPSRIHISTTLSEDASGSQTFMNVFLTVDPSPAAVPEPSTLVIMLATAVGLIIRAKRRRPA